MNRPPTGISQGSRGRPPAGAARSHARSQQSQALPDHRLASLESLCKALADATRLRILALLLRGEVCVCHIHESLGIPQPKASRHLAYLRRAGLVETRKDGQWVHYRLATLPDAVGRTLLVSVAHCLTHVPLAGQDRQRLDDRLGCCAPEPAAADLSFPCCAPGAPLLVVGRAGREAPQGGEADQRRDADIDRDGH
jgi:ArsR family transcriptional regulator